MKINKSNHAKEQMKTFRPYIGVAMSKFELMLDEVAGLEQDVAVGIDLPRTVQKNPIRSNWKACDVAAGIVRGGLLVTVMLSRTDQVNLDHFRVAEIRQ